MNPRKSSNFFTTEPYQSPAHQQPLFYSINTLDSLAPPSFPSTKPIKSISQTTALRSKKSSSLYREPLPQLVRLPSLTLPSDHSSAIQSLHAQLNTLTTFTSTLSSKLSFKTSQLLSLKSLLSSLTLSTTSSSNSISSLSSSLTSLATLTTTLSYTNQTYKHILNRTKEDLLLDISKYNELQSKLHVLQKNALRLEREAVFVESVKNERWMEYERGKREEERKGEVMEKEIEGRREGMRKEQRRSLVLEKIEERIKREEEDGERKGVGEGKGMKGFRAARLLATLLEEKYEKVKSQGREIEQYYKKISKMSLQQPLQNIQQLFSKSFQIQQYLNLQVSQLQTKQKNIELKHSTIAQEFTDVKDSMYNTMNLIKSLDRNDREREEKGRNKDVLGRNAEIWDNVRSWEDRVKSVIKQEGKGEGKEKVENTFARVVKFIDDNIE